MVTALFIDARAVGRPVCFRCVSSGFLNADQVMGLVNVTLPSGYRAMQMRVTSDKATPASLLFMNCQSVVLWAERIGPFPQIMEDDGSDLDGDE